MPTDFNTQSVSRYSSFYNYNKTIPYIFNIPPEELEDDTDIFITFNDGHKAFFIADKYYNDPRLWWVVCIQNGKNLPDDFEIGDTVRLSSNITQLFDKMQTWIDKQT